MLFFHPLLQVAAIILALYVLSIGINRFRSLHLKHKTMFKWKQHVLLGTIALVTWGAGMVGGLILVRIYWRGFLITGLHGKTALLMLPMILFGLISGYVMNKTRQKRPVLPLAHGINNLILTLLALTQLITGWGVIKLFVLGG
ncbi:MAG: DUF4079 domain-containing protein [Desulfobacteraceae bacterium]|nr:DUF4079 domain-containing protein [Desulfobacteraceae bacterium]